MADNQPLLSCLNQKQAVLMSQQDSSSFDELWDSIFMNQAAYRQNPN